MQSLLKKIKEQDFSLTSLEYKFDGVFWHYPSYCQEDSNIEMVFEARTSEGLVQFAIEYGDCLDDSGLVARLAAGGTPPTG